MQNRPADDQKEMELYHYRKRGWVFITFGVLVGLLLIWGATRFAGPLPALVVTLFFIWCLLEDLRVFPYSTVAIAISGEKIFLQQKNGKEKRVITQVTQVKEKGAGLTRGIEIRGLDPNGKKTIIRVNRGNLGKERHEDFRKYLEQFFPTGN